MYVIETICEAKIKIKRSEFIAQLLYADTIEIAKKKISQRSKQMHNAKHNCWAYIVGDQGQWNHWSDNGEPAGTAGKPILRVLQQHQLTNVTAIVTRYYGGVKLGIRGLINAYSEVMETAIQKQPLTKLIKNFSYLITTSYQYAEQIKYQLQKIGASIEKIDYIGSPTIYIIVEQNYQPQLLIFLEKQQQNNILSYTSC